MPDDTTGPADAPRAGHSTAEPGPDPAGGSPEPGAAPAGPGPLRTGRWRAIAAGAGAVLVAAVAVVVLIGRDGDDPNAFGGRVDAARRADPVPAGPVVRSIPFDCGVEYGTVDRLTPGAEKQSHNDATSETCTWETGAIANRLGGGNRELTVRVAMNDGTTGAVEAADDLTSALDFETRKAGGRVPGRVRPVTGLGLGAVTWNETEYEGALRPNETKPAKVLGRKSGTHVLFHAGNAFVSVAYAGADYEKKGRLSNGEAAVRMLPEKATLNGALEVALGIARGLGVRAGSPRVGEPPAAQARLRQPPDVCGLVPLPVLSKLRKVDSAKREKAYIVDGRMEGVQAARCQWQGPSFENIEADIAVATDSRLGDGRTVIAREYAKHYLRARDTRPEKRGAKVFSALTGPGDQAFAFYEKDTSSQGVVVFQSRNALVKVRYWSIDDIPKDRAVNVAHAAAREIATRLVG